jgi:YfiH family protein
VNEINLKFSFRENFGTSDRKIGCLFLNHWEDLGLKHGFLQAGFNFKNNFKSLADHQLKIVNQKLGLLNQTHSPEIVEVTAVDDFNFSDCQSLPADGWFGKLDALRNSAFAIKTADCVPVIIFCRKQKFWSLVHCGWKGIVRGAFLNAVQICLENGATISEIEVAFGPSAGKCCYEISDEALILQRECAERSKVEISRLGLQDDYSHSHAILEITEENCSTKYKADLHSLLSLQAGSLGIQPNQIYSANICTICSDRFYSFRRDQENSGRQLSFVGELLTT